MESLGASLEAEQRAKAEALRIKKKLESDINELEIALDHANKANAEGQKAIKRYQGQLRDTIQVSLWIKIFFKITNTIHNHMGSKKEEWCTSSG